MGGVVDAVFGGGPDMPAPPDPIATANAQGAANVEAARVTTALNRANQVTPWGNLTWSRGGGDWNEQGYNQALQLYNDQLVNYNKALSNSNSSQYDRGYAAEPENFAYYQHQQQLLNGTAPTGQQFTGTAPTGQQSTGQFTGQFTGTAPTAPKKEDYGYNPDAWTSTVTLDPRVQSLLDSSLATSQGLQTAIDNSLASTTSTLSQPIKAPGSIDINRIRQGVEGRYTDLQPSLQASNVLASMGRAGVGEQLSRLRNLYGQDFNYDSAPAMPTADEATRQRVEDALYGRSTARLDPRFAQGQDQLNSSLAAQGITQGSEAYNRELQNFNNAKNDAYSSAMNDAISGSDEAMQRIFTMGLQARQQGVNEANTLRTLPTQEAVALAGISDGLDTSSRNWYGAETAQETAKDNSAANEFNLQRTNNQDQFNNTIAARNQILNELNALRTGAQAQMPQFGNTQSGAQVAASPIAQSVYNSYQGELSGYNTQVGSNNAMLGGLANLGGAAMMAPAGTFAGLTAMF